MKTFSIPVKWAVWSKVQIRANEIDEALKLLRDNIDNIPLSDDGEYVDGSYKIYNDDYGFIEHQICPYKMAKILKDNGWDNSSGISGEDEDEKIGTPYFINPCF